MWKAQNLRRRKPCRSSWRRQTAKRKNTDSSF
uniref:Uncharacterized protein n=1 Tax=Anguilla anguilla TaxID=7936 RepID=A0A0E9RH70_ANGAN